jgi:hypothetical protein
VADGCFRTLEGLMPSQTTGVVSKALDGLRGAGRAAMVDKRLNGRPKWKSGICPFFSIDGRDFICPFTEAKKGAVYRRCVDDEAHAKWV